MDKLFKMKLSKIYPLLVNKAIRKDRTKKEVDEIINWLLGYDEKMIDDCLDRDIDYETFFLEAPNVNPKKDLIDGTICRVKISSIEDPIYQDMRRLDKMIDDLAKGKNLDKILK